MNDIVKWIFEGAFPNFPLGVLGSRGSKNLAATLTHRNLLKNQETPVKMVKDEVIFNKIIRRLLKAAAELRMNVKWIHK